MEKSNDFEVFKALDDRYAFDKIMSEIKSTFVSKGYELCGDYYYISVYKPEGWFKTNKFICKISPSGHKSIDDDDISTYSSFYHGKGARDIDVTVNKDFLEKAKSFAKWYASYFSRYGKKPKVRIFCLDEVEK